MAHHRRYRRRLTTTPMRHFFRMTSAKFRLRLECGMIAEGGPAIIVREYKTFQVGGRIAVQLLDPIISPLGGSDITYSWPTFDEFVVKPMIDPPTYCV